MRGWDRLLIVAFLAIIAAPGLGLTVGFDGAATNENRVLAPSPRWPASLEAAGAWADAFTRYFEDHFALRSDLVTTQAALRLRLFGVSPTPSVIAGRDGWLYYADDWAVEDYAVVRPLAQTDLETWARTLQDTQDWLQAQGIAYAFVLAPDKHVIYREPLPASIRQLRDSTWADQLVDYLRAHTDVNVVDLRPVLISAKRRERVYHRTDTHWNDRGAHAGYEAIIASLRGAHGLQARPRSAFHDVRRFVPGLDLAIMLGLTDRLVEEDLALEPKVPARARIVEPEDAADHGMYPRMATEIAGAGLPRAVIFRDSFTTALIPFLSEHFSRTLYLWEYDVNPDVIAAERPQVVIQQIVGRHLGQVLPYNYVAAGRLRRAFRDTAWGDPARSAGAAAARTAGPGSPE